MKAASNTLRRLSLPPDMAFEKSRLRMARNVWQSPIYKQTKGAGGQSLQSSVIG